jgi:hypothetical protein
VVLPVPENLAAVGINEGRAPGADVVNAVQKALVASFGGGTWIGNDVDGKQVGTFREPYLYLNEAEIAKALASGKAATRSQIEEVAANAAAAIMGIYDCYTRSQIRSGAIPNTQIGRAVLNCYYPAVSGDVVVVPEALHVISGGDDSPARGTSHGTPYAYDTHVPVLIAGPGVRSGVWTDPVSPADIAPTICALLGIEFPSGCDGKLLEHALK